MQEINNQYPKKVHRTEKIVLIAIICVFSISLNAQNKEKGKIGVVYSTFFNDNVLGKPYIENSYDVENSSAIGVNFLYPIMDGLELETGLEYIVYKIKTVPDLIPEHHLATYNDASFSMINIPLTIRYSLIDYFFCNGGILLGFDLEKEHLMSNQSGIGLMGGFGGKYDFTFGGSLFINPYVKLHSLIPFTGTENSRQRVLDLGIRMGFTYQL